MACWGSEGFDLSQLTQPPAYKPEPYFPTFFSLSCTTTPLTPISKNSTPTLMEYSQRGGGYEHHSGPMLSTEEYLESRPLPPPSYISHDLWPDSDSMSTTWRSLMFLHVAAFTLAFFVLLPISITLRSAKHKWHVPVWVAFHLSAGVGVFAGTLYVKLTPNLYEGSKHGRMGWATVALVAVLSTVDCFFFLRRLVLSLVRHPNCRMLGEIKLLLLGSHVDPSGHTAEYANLVHDDDELHEETIEAQPQRVSGQPAARPLLVTISPSHSRTVSFSEDVENGSVEEWRHHNSLYGSPTSNNSDLTLHGSSRIPMTPKKSRFAINEPISWRTRLQQASRILFHTVEHALVVLAFATSADGAVTYTGICRANELNGCLAHIIKGSIFWCYGLLSFARYLGAWRKLGWAWNRPLLRNAPSAEMIECFVIFTYGAANVWMERFGAAPGDSFTTKEIQHISIAVMFAFAGAIGIALESRTLRYWLSGTRSPTLTNATMEPPSFNPMPGMVIGVTGLAMSAHHQATQFLVQIHTLWGMLLAGFSALRWITYFLLWVRNRSGRPIASNEPSRPPTEVLASFCLSCGGLVFILSMEPVGTATIRAGHDDIMMFMNLAVSLTCFAFLWTFGVLAFNGYIKTRSLPTSSFHRPALSASPRRSESF
ncbi:hypothetical protein BKA62DRAFT_698188 [Auriculariales sp. MPI-PUGE-AT-0066]|nr:hypothetical protein BKA62DRAFT_698188 [Auriculariales sp. MPI-PUGE-AT-0066]